jgi:cephalosporin hydroxylase
MELSRINHIRNATPEELQDPAFLEQLIVKLGFNTEALIEQPEIVRNNGGGLLIWQYPSQFSNYLVLLQKQNISSYLEIGCRWGGTFVLTTEYLKRFAKLSKSVAVDIIDSPVVNYCQFSEETEFIKMDSLDPSFKEYMKDNKFDLIFIDGDHSYTAVKSDYESTKDSGKIFVFHDIISAACPGVVRFWNELKRKESNTYTFYEFTQQYDDVWENTNQNFLGIGVAIKLSQ